MNQKMTVLLSPRFGLYFICLLAFAGISALEKNYKLAAAEAIAAGKVQLNWAVCTKAAAEVAQGDTVSLRGLGKCCVEEVGNQTKKGRIFVSIKRYL